MFCNKLGTPVPLHPPNLHPHTCQTWCTTPTSTFPTALKTLSWQQAHLEGSQNASPSETSQTSPRVPGSALLIWRVLRSKSAEGRKGVTGLCSPTLMYAAVFLSRARFDTVCWVRKSSDSPQNVLLIAVWNLLRVKTARPRAEEVSNGSLYHWLQELILCHFTWGNWQKYSLNTRNCVHF